MRERRLRKDTVGWVGLAVLGGHLLAVALCALIGRWTWMGYALSLQYIAIGTFAVGAVGMIAQTLLSPRYREFSRWMPHSHVLRDRAFHRYLEEERKRGFRFFIVLSLIAVILYGSSRVILHGMR
ncbi:MAG TPA: hypothetical protein EYH30_05890 [Anaerolineales bacterium]|nr:hypothetical protein [Anaerolineae bacterium]HIQ01644.1 hypothetical protein [Anaerolineales bacterium]